MHYHLSFSVHQNPRPPEDVAALNDTAYQATRHRPWNHTETGLNIPLVLQHYQMIAWEFGPVRKPNALRDTDWEHPNLLSVCIVRDPIERILSDDKNNEESEFYGIHHSPVSQPLELWWKWANQTQSNFMVRRLAHAEGVHTRYSKIQLPYSTHMLDQAKTMLKRMTIVLDIACLDESMQALLEVLTGSQKQDFQRTSKFLHHSYPSMEKRIPHKDIYAYLLQRNQMDVDLYEWVKQELPTLVRCGDRSADQRTAK
jgi:hypothetical protein